MFCATVFRRAGDTLGKANLDAGEPPQIVFEGRTECVDAPGAETLLDQSLAAARAPSGGWVVFVRVERVGANALRADGDVIDETGTSVAHRVLSGPPANCAGLARAMSVWASLVLDAELIRPISSKNARADAPTARTSSMPVDPPTAPVTLPVTLPVTPMVTNRRAVEIDGPLDESKDAQRVLVGRQIMANDSAPAVTDEPRTFEVGLGTFLMANTGGKAFFGVTPHVVVQSAHGILLRPAISVGESLSGAGSGTQWLSARFDMCSRIHGMYPKGGGLQLDLCGGPDMGFMIEPPRSSGTTMPFVSLGPSVDLGADLVQYVSVVLRGVAGVDLVPLGASGRMDLALAWKMP